MLSRIAESLFWIGRYVERVDGTARIVDVIRLSMLEGPAHARESSAQLVLSAIMGGSPSGRVSYDDLRDRLVFDQANPSSIAGSWYAARENARRARETLSVDLWEAINTAWLRWRQLGTPDRTARHVHWARERAILVAGIADSTMSHDDAWNFLSVGRFLERADMTARMVNTGTLPIVGLSWQSVLSSCGGQQAFLRSNSGLATDRRVAAFLVLNRQFPRSVLYAMRKAEACLTRMEPHQPAIGFADDGRRLLGQTRTSLEFSTEEDVLEDLPVQMRRVQRAVSQVSEHIAGRYFPSTPLTFWTEGVS